MILAFAAALKLVSAAGTARLLSEPDPILGLSVRHAFLFAGCVEAAVVCLLVFLRSPLPKLVLIAGLSTNFLLYRLGLSWMGMSRPCPCLGNAAAWTHIKPTTLDSLMLGSMVCLMAASWGPLLLMSIQSRIQKRPGPRAFLPVEGAPS